MAKPPVRAAEVKLPEADVQKNIPRAKKKNGRKKGRQPGKIYCTALGDTCMNHPCKGRRTCRMHGGTQKVGAESHAYRGKGQSKYLPRRLSERLDAALADPNFLSQARRIGQMTARCEELWDALANAEKTANWSELQELWREMWAANAAYSAAQDDAEKSRQLAVMTEKRAAIETLVTSGAGEQVAWDEFRKAADATRRLIESERRREVESQQVLTMNQVAMLIDMYAAAVRKNVTDPAELHAISAEFVRIGGHSLPAADGVGPATAAES